MNLPTFKFALRSDLTNDSQFLPTKAEPYATGWDVRVANPDRGNIIVQPNQYIKIPLGFRAFCPPGWWFELKPRSSSFAKKRLHALYGTIDEQYENEVVFAAQYIPDPYDYSDPLTLNFGEAIGQIIPVKRQEMETVAISNEEFDALCQQRQGVRGTGGFGSTGK